MKKVHFIGIGGIGTSALAQIYLHKGYTVSGSDIKASELTKRLSKAGAQISIGHDAKNITNQKLVIYSPAIPANNPERQAAKEKGIPSLTYPEALGDLSKEYFTIAISGTHGKSTTTAMTALILEQAGLEPTVVIGTKIKEFNNQNYKIGKSRYLVIEACEYKESFKHLKPDILVITNIEAEHLDYYKTEENYMRAFRELCQSLPASSKLIINSEDQNSLEASKNIVAETHQHKGSRLQVGVPGEHNQKNAQSAYLVGQMLEIPKDTIENSLRNFKGTWRRMEYLGQKKETRFYDDYAHHPTEIKATLKALRQHWGLDKKILTIFQPHQYSRTYELLEDFANSFEHTNQVIIPNIYRVRDTEEDVAKVSTDDLVKRIGEKAINGGGLEQTANWLSQNYQNFDVIIIMGAGDIESLASSIFS